jgi:hypothetical protein
MFVGALFRDSSAKILRHYRWLVDEVEHAAEELAEKQINEEEAKHEYFENVSEWSDFGIQCTTIVLGSVFT